MLQMIGTASFGLGFMKYGLTVSILVGAPIYLGMCPKQFTPLVQVLFSTFLALLAFWIGTGAESERARRQANAKWLPHAEAVTYRLMTLFANVATMGIKTRKSCVHASCELPELKDENMRAVRVRLKAECEASADRLSDIAKQLQDAIEDWRRFISENCQGEECNRIFQGLQRRKRGIKKQLRGAKEAAPKPKQAEPKEPADSGPS